MQRVDDLLRGVEGKFLGRPATPDPDDAAIYDWYGGECPCGLEPGRCKTHHRARPNQHPAAGDWRTCFWMAGRGFGKMVCMNTPVPIPGGWTTMGELKVGDEVFDESGRVCRVTFVSVPEVPREAYRLTFSDGSTIDACADHQWVTWAHAERKAFLRSPYEDTTRFPAEWPAWRLKRKHWRWATPAVAQEDSPGPQIRTTRQIVDTLTYGGRGDLNHCIPHCGPLALPDADLPINPYVLGAWLGDGDSAGAVLTCHDDDVEILDYLRAEGCPVNGNMEARHGFTGRYGIGRTLPARDPATGRMVPNGSLHSKLGELGLIGNKHVPAPYLRASTSQRLALLQGLMDTDGGVEGGSLVSFTSCNKRLTDAVSELAVSLGMKTRRDERPAKMDGVAYGIAYRVNFTPTMPVFRLARKADRVRFDVGQQLRRHHRMIVKAERIKKPGLMRCIAVDSPHRMYLCGEGMIPTHNTRVGAEWVRHHVESGGARRVAIVGPTERDVRRVMIEGESGILAISPPWFRPTYNSSIGQLFWPNGAIATAYSAECPERLRGPQHDSAWCDEICAWSRPNTWDMLMFGLRLGADPRVVVTSTPKPSKLIRDLIEQPTTTLIRGSTYDNREHLAPAFMEQVIAKYEGTRLGQQELSGELLEVMEGAWFPAFDPAKHVTERAEYDPRLPVHLAIDAGTSRTTAAVWFQVMQTGPHTHRVTIFGDYMQVDTFSEANARAIRARSGDLPCHGRLDTVVIDPASTARSSLGPAAYGEYERVFGRHLSRAVGGLILDGLDQIELLLDLGNLLLHPRCVHAKAAFQNYARARRGGEWLDEPASPQSPHEDVMDALRYGVRSRFPEGRTPPPSLHRVSARGVF